MKRSTLALLHLLFLLTLASQGTWCAAAGRSTKAEAAHHLRPHLQVQGLHEPGGKKLLEIQSPRKLGHGTMGAGMGGPGGGAGAGGRTTGGGAANTRPHSTKNGGAVALPAPVTSILALIFSSAILLSAFSF